MTSTAFFQRLPLPRGGYEIVLYLDGFRTERRRIYLSPGATFRLELAMEPPRAGRSERTGGSEHPVSR